MKLVQKWAPLEKESSFAQVRSLWGENFAALETEVEEAWEGCVVMGSYTGACEEGNEVDQEVTLGFSPRVVLIYPKDGGITDTSGRKYGSLFSPTVPAPESTCPGVMTQTGFQVRNRTRYLLNYSNKVYIYLAVR